EEHSEQKSNRLKKLFNRGWWIAEGAVAVSSSIFLMKHDPMAAALTLSAGATGVKTLAWFKHTTKTDEELLPDMLTPKNPKLLGLAQKAARIGYSWGWAFFEYVQLTIANRVADVVPVRGAIEVMDLVWMATFMYMVKGDKLKWQQAAGLAAAAAGVGIANL
ncbi:MAG: DMT family protein, partial [Burkholderiales bacterium]|nr:DMT family protein [Burkholderiales bacterium]